MLTLAKQLGLATTAEGIETSAQLEELRRLGCTEAQGYFFGKPAPATEARGLFALDAVPENQSGIASSNRVGHAA